MTEAATRPGRVAGRMVAGALLGTIAGCGPGHESQLTEYVASFPTSAVGLNESDQWYYLALSVDELRRRGRPPQLDHLKLLVEAALERDGDLSRPMLLCAGGIGLLDGARLAELLPSVGESPEGSRLLRARLEADALSPSDRESRLAYLEEWPTADVVYMRTWLEFLECFEALGVEPPGHWRAAIHATLEERWDPGGVFGPGPSDSREAAALMLRVGVPESVDLARMRKAARRMPGNRAAKMEFLLTLSHVESLLDDQKP